MDFLKLTLKVLSFKFQKVEKKEENSKIQMTSNPDQEKEQKKGGLFEILKINLEKSIQKYLFLSQLDDFLKINRKIKVEQFQPNQYKSSSVSGSSYFIRTSRSTPCSSSPTNYREASWNRTWENRRPHRPRRIPRNVRIFRMKSRSSNLVEKGMRIHTHTL